MERIIPDLEKGIVIPLLGSKISKEAYLEKIAKFERECEKSLIDTLSRVRISATVKTDPYSLPYKDELMISLKGESYLNGPYEFYRVARPIVKELLNKNVYQLRFYLFVNVVTDKFIFGQVDYHFRYTVKA